MTQVSHILHAVRLFQDLDSDALSALARLMIPQKLNAGSVVFQESDESDALYIIEEGSVVVSKHVRDDVDIVLTRFRPGDFFGEMSLIDGKSRSMDSHRVLFVIARGCHVIDVFHYSCFLLGDTRGFL